MDSNYTIPSSSYAPPTSEPVLRPADPLLPWMSDALLSCLSPIVMYWIVSMFFHYIDTHNYFEKYRLHTPEEVLKRNHVSRYDVIRDVIIQQIFQFCVGALLGLTEPEEMTGGENWTIYNISQWVGWTASALLTAMGINGDKLGQNIATYVLAYGGSYGATLVGLDWRWKVAEAVYNIAIPLLRLSVAIFILDAWQYFWHRLMHQVPWLYRNIHARHHRLYVPYAFGALYNHPAEGLILDTLGAAIAYKISGMTMKGSVVFFGFCCMKTVDDHCGYKLPFDPLQLIFSNNAAFHDIHHQGWGIKNNFSQPFLICWDRWLGTMYTGGDAAERNQRTRERVHKQIELEAIKREQRAAAPIVDEYASRRALPEEDDTEFMTTSVVNKPSTAAATPETPKPRRRTRTITLADVTGKDVAGGLKDTEKWANDIVGNVSGAKLR